MPLWCSRFLKFTSLPEFSGGTVETKPSADNFIYATNADTLAIKRIYSDATQGELCAMSDIKMCSKFVQIYFKTNDTIYGKIFKIISSILIVYFQLHEFKYRL